MLRASPTKLERRLMSKILTRPDGTVSFESNQLVLAKCTSIHIVSWYILCLTLGLLNRVLFKYDRLKLLLGLGDLLRATGGPGDAEGGI